MCLDEMMLNLAQSSPVGHGSTNAHFLEYLTGISRDYLSIKFLRNLHRHIGLARGGGPEDYDESFQDVITYFGVQY